jgi:coiled-coil and C2 domain-containing protein 2A
MPRIVNPYVNTYVSLYITMDPVPNFLKSEDLDYVPGFEDSIFLINTSKWLKGVKENPLLKERNIRVLAENFDGYSVFLPKYLKPGGQKPHSLIFDENVIDDSIAIEKVARYVSLIPFIGDAQAFGHDEIPDCWCTDEQFLTLGFGDYSEHAILLCNYFNYIDKIQNTSCVSYIILGKAYPEGMTTYVMRMSTNTPEVEFWNGKTGECFYYDKSYKTNTFLCCTVSRSFNNTKTTADSICQLKEVGCIVTFDNVYVNVQDFSDPGLIDLDLKDETKWKPFLNDISKQKYFPKGITTIQKDLFYEDPSVEEADELNDKIFEHLKRNIEISRAAFGVEGKALRTKWERVANEKIKRILADYDFYCFTKKKSGINVIDRTLSYY